mmetsp:Transcript_19932/g.60483  ORF Transcript_19932/g.60483 Transcript_19932/m.60483 type:complete len:115 (+) Transcript_19932:3227-3571(+)|eukprot:scaffold73494_cov35-Tisochrysis_lutea.AAC.1
MPLIFVGLQDGPAINSLVSRRPMPRHHLLASLKIEQHTLPCLFDPFVPCQLHTVHAHDGLVNAYAFSLLCNLCLLWLALVCSWLEFVVVFLCVCRREYESPSSSCTPCARKPIV